MNNELTLSDTTGASYIIHPEVQRATLPSTFFIRLAGIGSDPYIEIKEKEKPKMKLKEMKFKEIKTKEEYIQFHNRFAGKMVNYNGDDCKLVCGYVPKVIGKIRISYPPLVEYYGGWSVDSHYGAKESLEFLNLPKDGTYNWAEIIVIDNVKYWFK